MPGSVTRLSYGWDGAWIAELCGLPENGHDFKNGVINVGHPPLQRAEIGYYIEGPKTQSAIKQILKAKSV